MDQKIRKLLAGEGGNYIFPFFWQHGETEEVLREYMKVIAESNIGAVCVESRPHPDFVGEKWWQDMDVILDEARKRNMKVWILDDSHFPTGYANGALKNADGKLRRQSLTVRSLDCPKSGNDHEDGYATVKGQGRRQGRWNSTCFRDRNGSFLMMIS